MARVPLLGGAYQSRSVIASAQRCVNLYAEKNADPQAPVPFTYYQTPGLDLNSQGPEALAVRCTYRTSTGVPYVVIGATVYFLTPNGALVPVGTITDRPEQVIMADNGLVVVLVDGANGWVIDIATNAFHQIVDPSFYGAAFVVFLDTFFCFNRPGTNQFYISLSMANYGLLSGTSIASGTITTPGLEYDNGLHSDVPLTGGSGTGATADITVGGTGVRTGTITNAGSLYTNGTYTNVPLTGGGGTNARANITVAGGVVTLVDIITPGSAYVVNNNLSATAASIGGTGSGFVFRVDTIGGVVTDVSINQPGQNYIIGDVLSAASADLGSFGSGFTYTMDTFALAFDPLDIAAKAGSADNIVGLATTQKILWLIGELTTEPWIGTGAADFYFQQVQGAYIDHGCAAAYSISNMDVAVFWLMQDKQGAGIIVKTEGYALKEISTPAIVADIKKYITLSDAIGYCYQLDDHAYYVIVFPQANKTWQYDLTTGEWNELAWLNPDDGSLNRHRGNCSMYVYNKNLIGDWDNGKIYELNSSVYTDDGNPIPRIRTFPHLIEDGNKVSYTLFIADVETGSADAEEETAPLMSLRFSANKGVSYNYARTKSFGYGGQYLIQPSWRKIGVARDGIFELSWDAPIKTSLNGAFIEKIKATS